MSKVGAILVGIAFIGVGIAVSVVTLLILQLYANSIHIISNCTYISVPNVQWDCSLTNISAFCYNNQVKGLSDCNATQVSMIQRNTTTFINN